MTTEPAVGGTLGGDAISVPAMSLRHLSKSFGDSLVLDDVSLDVQAGEVHALVGSNGSGKSTLMKIVTGVYAPSKLEALSVAGVNARLPLSRKELRRLGVRVVHQSLGLVPELSVTENVALSGGYQTRFGTIGWRRTAAQVTETLEGLGVELSPSATVGELASWQQVAVALARVFYGDLKQTRLVLLDEVTAAMPREEVARLFDLLRRLTGGGVGVLYVTHRFEEIFAIAQRATVIRDGRVVQTRLVRELSSRVLVDALTGAESALGGTVLAARSVAERLGEPTVQLQRVSGATLRGVHLSARAGEVLGVTGRAGCGKSELGRIVFGLQSPEQGTVHFQGYAGGIDARSLIAHGVAYVPEHRYGQALLHGGSVRENLTLPSLSRFGRPWWLSKRQERQAASRATSDYAVSPPDPERLVETLSGGNQQKVVLARWLIRKPRLIVLDEPTEGVDVPSRNDIYSAVRASAAAGATVLVLSSSVEEIVELCDRAVVLDEGRIVADLSGDALEVRGLSHLIEQARTHV